MSIFRTTYFKPVHLISVELLSDGRAGEGLETWNKIMIVSPRFRIKYASLLKWLSVVLVFKPEVTKAWVPRDFWRIVNSEHNLAILCTQQFKFIKERPKNWETVCEYCSECTLLLVCKLTEFFWGAQGTGTVLFVNPQWI
jgi:hypothetical protein